VEARNRDGAEPFIGREILGQYVLVERIGAGGMGLVYLAEQPAMGRQAVVKLLQPRLAGDAQVAARFQLEARAAAALNHPHIVTVYNYGLEPARGPDTPATLFLAMEFLDGRSLDRVLAEEGPLPARRAIHIARQIAEALAAAHARGVVHRDLKPANVMLVSRGRDHDFVKVLDFGIAKVEGITLTGGDTIFGTPEYMSPEQLRGQPLDGRSDLYALGVVLFELLAGRLPFAGATPEAQLAAHLEALPPSLAELAPGVPRGVAALVAQLLAKDRQARPASAEALAPLWTAALGDDAAPLPPPRTASPTAAAWRGRVLVATLTIALVALIGVVMVWLRPPPRAPMPGELVHALDTAAAPVPTPPPPRTPPFSVTPSSETPPPLAPDARTLEQLEREWSTLALPLSSRDRRGTLRALYARIDAAGGPADERARKKRAAVAELIRQHAN
jgi:serine/threonine-protein kinase